jgi:hypothetical protein
MVEFLVQYQVNFRNSVHHGTKMAVREFWLIKGFQRPLLIFETAFYKAN